MQGAGAEEGEDGLPAASDERLVQPPQFPLQAGFSVGGFAACKNGQPTGLSFAALESGCGVEDVISCS